MNYNNLGEILSTNDHFTTLSKQHRKKLIQMVNRVLCGENVHRELFPPKEIGSVSFHSIMLKKWFRNRCRILGHSLCYDVFLLRITSRVFDEKS